MNIGTFNFVNMDFWESTGKVVRQGEERWGENSAVNLDQERHSSQIEAAVSSQFYSQDGLDLSLPDTVQEGYQRSWWNLLTHS